MTFLRSLWWCGLIWAASFYCAHAQFTNSSSANEDLATMIQAIELATPTPVASLPTAGTFWSAQHAPGTTQPWPPLPANILTLDAWSLGDGNFLLDDTNVDYPALTAAAEAAQASSVSPMVRMSMMASSLATIYAYSNPVYLTNLAASFAGDGSMTTDFGITGGTNFVPYDILMTTNLLTPVGGWNWLGIGYTSNNYTFTEQPANDAFYLLAKPSKTMTVAWGVDTNGQCDVPFGLTNTVQAVRGFGFSLALSENGTVAAWGSNSASELGPATASLAGVVMITAGWNHGVALFTNGTVTAWGDDLFGETNVPPGLSNVVVVSAQVLHSLALLSNSTVVAWGDGAWGDTNVPPGLTNVTAIAAGGEFNLAVSNGYVVAWGVDNDGQCDVPPGLSNVWDVAAGWNHSVALLESGTVVCWGDDGSGECDVPAGLTNVVAIAAGGDPQFTPSTAYTLALRKDGSVVAWGNGPVLGPISGLINIIALGGGPDHALAVRTGPPTPVITEEPTDEYQVQGSNATFTARGAGLYGVTYQWQTNSVDIAGATNASLTLTNVQAAQLGSYDVVVTDNGGMGSITSSNVTFSFVTPPVILSQTLPTNQVVTYQNNLVLEVAASAPGTDAGFPISYQWQLNGVNIPHANESSYTNQAGGSSAGTYTVVISNAAGSTNTSWQVAVYYAGLLISQQPTNQYQLAGGNVTFVGSAVASNTVTYQWAFDGTNIAGATDASLTLTNVQAAQQGNYDFTASDGVGNLTSSNALFTLVTPPSIVSETLPTNQVAGVSSNVTLSVVATAPGITNGFPLFYQWQFNGTNIAGQTSTNYAFNAYSFNKGIYSVIVSNAAGSTTAAWQIDVLNPGSLAGWGDNEDGESTVPLGVSNILNIAAGEYHAVAVEDNGSVIQWGYNWGSIPADLTNVVAVAAGYDHSIALRSDGTVETWGNATNDANYVPAGTAGVEAVAAGWDDNVVLLTNGTVTAWGLDGDIFGWGDLTDTTGLTNITAISAAGYHALALTTNGTVLAWGDDREGESDVPAGLSNVVAVAAGGQHSLALLTNGTVVAWGYNNAGQCNVPVGLSNVMAIAAGWEHSVAVLNNGTVVVWGDDSAGQTNTPALNQVKLITAGGDFTIAGIFSPTVMYPVDVTRDLLLIYNTNSADSAAVLNYYLQHRPMVGGANVLGIGFPGFYATNLPAYGTNGYIGQTNTMDYETIGPTDFTNLMLNPVTNWLAQNPTKRPQYVILFLDVPSRVNASATNAANAPFYPNYTEPSVSYQLATTIFNWQPFVTHINMNGTNDCIAYINKLAALGTNSSVSSPVLSASRNGYANTNWYFDGANDTGLPAPNVSELNASNAVVMAGAALASVNCVSGFYTNNGDILADHMTNGLNVAGYLCWGAHSALGANYPINGYVQWSGNSGWWLIETVESFNGQRYEIAQANYIKWFSSNAFGGTSYSNTPIGAGLVPNWWTALG